MADVTEVIKRLIVEAQTRGLDKAAADFEKFGTAAKGAATSTENALASTSKSFERLAGSIDPARKEIQALARDLKTLESGRGKGVSDEYINGLKEARTAAAALAVEAAKTNAALGQQAQVAGAHARAVGLSGNAMKNLGFQLNDAVTMLASGSSLFQVMATQGGQVTQELQGGGGIVANVKDLGTRLVGLVTPARVAFGGIAAGAALAGMAMAEHADATKEFENTLKGIGRASGATVDQLMAVSDAAAKSGDISVSSSRELVNAYARTGKIGKENLGALAAQTENFAATTGTDLKQATETLKTAFSDPAKGIDTLATALGGVNGELRETVINFAESGQGAKAQAAMMEVLEKNTMKARDALGVFGKMWHDFSKDVSDVKTAVGSALAPGPGDMLKRISDERDAIRSGAVPEATAGGNQQRLAELDQEYDKIKKIVDAKEQQAQAERNVKEAKDRSIQADRVVDKVLPDAKQLQQVENQIKLITDALADDEKGWNKLSEATRRNYQDTLESLNVQKQAKEGGRFAGQFGEGPVGARMARREEDATNQIASVTAITQAEQQAAAVATALTAARREGATAAEQQQIATNTLAVAQATASTEMQKALNAQQGQISGLQQLQGAVGQGATAMAVLTAKLQEEQSLRAAGINIMSAEAQQRIANAGAIAQETAALQDQVRARQVLQQARGQVQMLRAEAGMISSAGADYGDPREAALRDRNLSILKGQIEARRLSSEGLTEEAAAVRKSSKAVAEATYKRDSARITAQEQAQHAAQFEGMTDSQISRAITQGLEPAAVKQMDAARAQQEAADEQRAAAASAERAARDWSRAPGGPSSFSTKWAPKTQESTINAPPGYETVLTGSVHGGRAGGGLSYDVSYTKGKELLKQEAEQAAAAQEKRAGGVKQQSDLARQTLGTAISTANTALGKQIEALRDATEKSTDAQNKRTELEGKLKEQEDKRQQRIQNYLAAGPSPFEQNADIFYDPKKRMAFAESIAGGIDEQLKVQIAAARAEADAADAAQKSAEAQIKHLEDQQEALQYQSDLLSAGVDLSKAEVDGINALINEIRSGLPENIATQFSRIFQAQAGQATTQAKDIEKATGVGAGSYAMQTTTAMGGGGSAANPLGSYSAFAYDPYSSSTTQLRRSTIGGFASGGEFTVPGSYGAGDRPFVMGLAGQEKVTIQTPGQQRSGGSRGTSIENLIVQMPPMTDPIVYLNKRSRPALGRAIRNTARGMA